MQWIKLYAGTATNPKFKAIAREAKVRVGDALGAWLMLLEEAGKHGGDISGLNPKIIEAAFELKPGKGELIIAAMRELDMLEDMVVKGWRTRQAVEGASGYDRVKRHREKQKSASDNAHDNADDNGMITDDNAHDNADDNGMITDDNGMITDDNGGVTPEKGHIPIDIKIKNKRREELNPPTPQRGEAAGKATGDSLPELRKAMSDYAGGNVELADALEEFRKMRERIRKPLTGHALKLTLRDLDKLAGADDPLKIAIVEQSIQRGWQGVFAPSEQARASPAAPTEFQKRQQENRDMAAMALQFRKQGRENEAGNNPAIACNG